MNTGRLSKTSGDTRVSGLRSGVEAVGTVGGEGLSDSVSIGMASGELQVVTGPLSRSCVGL